MNFIENQTFEVQLILGNVLESFLQQALEIGALQSPKKNVRYALNIPRTINIIIATITFNIKCLSPQHPSKNA